MEFTGYKNVSVRNFNIIPWYGNNILYLENIVSAMKLRETQK